MLSHRNLLSMADQLNEVDPMRAEDDFVSFLAAGAAERYPVAPMKRSVQPKQHGLVRAEFTVESGLPEDLLQQLHHRWAVGDVLMWDNRAAMHYRTPVNPRQRRVMWRSQFQGEPVVMA